MLLVLSALLLASSPKVATPDMSAAQFAVDLYAAYRNAKGTSTDYSSLLNIEEHDIYSRNVSRLLDADRARTPEGYEGALDSDPLCQCQDSEGMRLERVKQRSLTANKADVVVTLRFVNSASKIVHLHLLLVREAEGWRVDDVRPSRGRTLKQALQPLR